MSENEYVVNGDTTTLLIYSSSHGLMAFLIDTDDKEKVEKYKWCIQRCRRTNRRYDIYYAKATERGAPLLHRLLLNAQKGKVVDHIDKNTFDNRKQNLREVSYAENNVSVLKHRNSPSGHVGVRFNKCANKWHAFIGKDYHVINLGFYSELKDAIKARKDGELKYYGQLQIQ